MERCLKMNKVNQANANFIRGNNCSQAVFTAFSEGYGIDKQTAQGLSCGFGGGMGRLGKTCGAVTGAYLVIGLACSKESTNDSDTKEKTYSLIQKFDEEFKRRNQTTECSELLGINLLTDQSHEAKTKVKTICPRLVNDSAEILESILNTI